MSGTGLGSLVRGALPLLVVALCASACRDYEQQARALGDAARRQAAGSCTEEGDPIAQEGCIAQKCHAACEAADLAKSFVAICVEECRQTGVCNVSEDCGPGRACVAIAPRVRRCEPSQDAAAPAP